MKKNRKTNLLWWKKFVVKITYKNIFLEKKTRASIIGFSLDDDSQINRVYLKDFTFDYTKMDEVKPHQNPYGTIYV